MTDPNIGYDSPFVTIDEDIFGPGIDWPDGRVHAELRPRCPCLRVRPRAVGPRPSLPACQLTPASAWAWSARCATWARRMWTGSWPRRRRSSAPEPCRTCTAAWTGGSTADGPWQGQAQCGRAEWPRAEELRALTWSGSTWTASRTRTPPTSHP